MCIKDKFFAFFTHRAVSRGKYNIAKSRKSRKDGVTWQLLARLDNRLLAYKEKRTSYLGLFVCAVRFNLDLANVCNSKLTKKTMKNNCRVRNESSSSVWFLGSLSDWGDFQLFQQCSLEEWNLYHEYYLSVSPTSKKYMCLIIIVHSLAIQLTHQVTKATVYSIKLSSSCKIRE